MLQQQILLVWFGHGFKTPMPGTSRLQRHARHGTPHFTLLQNVTALPLLRCEFHPNHSFTICETATHEARQKAIELGRHQKAAFNPACQALSAWTSELPPAPITHAQVLQKT